MRWISDTGASWHSAEGKLEFPLKVCLQFKALSGVRIRLCLLDCAVICYLLFRSLLNLDTVRISNVQCVIKPGHWTQASASTCFVVNIQSWTHSGLQKSNVDFEMFQKNSWTIKVFLHSKMSVSFNLLHNRKKKMFCHPASFNFQNKSGKVFTFDETFHLSEKKNSDLCNIIWIWANVSYGKYGLH